MTEPAHDVAPPALIFRRLAALFYDVLVITGLLMIATFPYLWLLQWTAGSDEVGAGDPVFRFYLLALVFGYVWLSWRRAGQTIGMKAWRLRAETLDGNLLSSSQILLRFVAAIPAILLFGAGYLWCFLRADRRSLQEVFSDSRTRHLPKQ